MTGLTPRGERQSLDAARKRVYMEALVPDEPTPIEVEDVYVCPYCGSLLALAIQPGSMHPEDGIWACPSCAHAQCGLCSREACHHLWGWFTDHGTYRVDVVACAAHTSGLKRRTWGGLHNSEPLEMFLTRCGWRTPVWLRKYATRDVNDGHVGYIEYRDDWHGLFQFGCSCSGRSSQGFESISTAGDNAVWHLVRQAGRVPAAALEAVGPTR